MEVHALKGNDLSQQSDFVSVNRIMRAYFRKQTPDVVGVSNARSLFDVQLKRGFQVANSDKHWRCGISDVDSMWHNTAVKTSRSLSACSERHIPLC